MTENIQIDPEFQAYIPPLTDEEFRQLEQNLLTDGCRDPLVAWSLPCPEIGEHKCYDEEAPPGGNAGHCELVAGDGAWTCEYCQYNPAPFELVLLDGHNRYAICQKHGLEYDIEDIELEDREAAMDWIDANQLGRRNLNPDQASILRGRRYNRMKRQGARTDLTLCQSGTKLETAEELAKQHGVSKRTIKRDGKRAEAFDRLQVVAPEQAKLVMDGAKRFNSVRREIQLSHVKEAAALPTDTYRVIYADPPWKYGDQLTESYGAAKWHYPSMSITELCALPIEDLAQDDAVLFLWVTSPLLYEAFPVINAWGFEYKACFVWDKIKHNMGHYNSVRHEFLLICTRGRCQPDETKLFDSVQSIERSGKHSEKPQEFREIIRTLYPHGNRLELFARGEHEGWEVWGNEPM